MFLQLGLNRSQCSMRGQSSTRFNKHYWNMIKINFENDPLHVYTICPPYVLWWSRRGDMRMQVKRISVRFPSPYHCYKTLTYPFGMMVSQVN